MDMQRKKGFTTVELLITIVIIGILLAIAMISYNGIVERANTELCLTNQRTLRLARMLNFSNNNVYGNNLEQLGPTLNSLGLEKEGSFNHLLCPNGGEYTFYEDSSEITCSIERHNL